MTANDPWATEPEAPAEPAQTAAPAPAAAKTATAPSVETDNHGVTLSFKGGPGYDAPMIALRANDTADMLALMGGNPTADGDVLVALMGRAANAAKYFSGLFPKPGGGGTSSSASQNAGPKPGAPAGQPPTQQGPAGGQACIHGSMEFRSKVSKSGKAYEGYFCQSGDRDDECKVRNFKWL